MMICQVFLFSLSAGKFCMSFELLIFLVFPEYIVGEVSWESLGLQGDPTSPKGNQSCGFIGRTDAEAETPILCPPDAKNWLIWKDPDAGEDWRQEEKGTTEDDMVGRYHWLNGHEFE